MLIMKSEEDITVLKERLLSLCQNIYGKRKINFQAINFGDDIGKFILFVRKNRLAHYFAFENVELFKKDKTLFDIFNNLISEYNDYKTELLNSIRDLKNSLDAKDFLIVKTFTYFPHLTSDIDLLVKDENTAEYIKNRFSEKSPLPIDVNTKISWGGADAISNNFVWRNTDLFSFEGIDFLVPNATLDILIRLAHIPFELAHIKLGELLYIYRQFTISDRSELKKEVKFMGWSKTFSRMLKVLDMLHNRLFDTPFSNKTLVPGLDIQSLEFPFKIPLTTLIAAVSEKKAWGKIFGARFIVKERLTEWLKKNFP